MSNILPDILQTLIDGTYKIVDASIQTRPEAQSAVMPLCLKELKESIIQYEEIKPENYTVDTGLRLSSVLNSRLIGSPHRISRDGAYFVVADYNKGITIFDNSWNMKRLYNFTLAPYSAAQAVGVTNTHYIVGTSNYILYAINKDTGDVDWEFGVYGARGKCVDGKIGSVFGVDTLPNGNILVATSNGAVSTNKYNGTVEEFDSTGVWIKTHLQYDDTGIGVDGETLNPCSLRVYGAMVYVGMANRIDVFSYDDTTQTLQYSTAITTPNDSTVLNLALTDFSIEDNILYILSNSLKKVIGFDLTTKDLVFSVGHYNFENMINMVHEGNTMNSPYGICVEAGKIHVADVGNKQIIEVFADDFIHPTYNLPNDYRLIYSNLEIVNGVVSTPVGIEPPPLHLVYTTYD